MTTDTEPQPQQQALSPVEQYRAMKAADEQKTDPRVLRAYDIQDKMLVAKEQYERFKKELQELLGEIGPYSDDTYKVSNLKRAPRKIDMVLLRENMPELVEKAEPSEKYILQALLETFGKETLLRMAYDHNPKAYDEARTLSIQEFDKLTGDTSKARKFVGKAYHDRWIEDTKGELCITRIREPLMMRLPGRHPQLCEGDGENDL